MSSMSERNPEELVFQNNSRDAGNVSFQLEVRKVDSVKAITPLNVDLLINSRDARSFWDGAQVGHKLQFSYLGWDITMAAICASVISNPAINRTGNDVGESTSSILSPCVCSKHRTQGRNMFFRLFELQLNFEIFLTRWRARSVNIFSIDTHWERTDSTKSRKLPRNKWAPQTFGIALNW
jgi:hypothetical protein